MRVHGDDDLAQRLLPHLGRHPWAAAVVEPSGARTAARDLPLGADLEIGSVSKGFTGLLYADAVERGEVRPDDPLGRHLPLGTSPVAGVTLASLSTHRSGVPSLPSTGLAVRRGAAWLLAQRNPYGDSLEQMLAQVRRTRLVDPGTSAYSNLGFQLLGHALAAAAGSSFADLVSRRIAEPLGLRSLRVPAHRSDIGPHDVVGRSRHGLVAQPWTGEALGPAGAIRLSIDDLAVFVSALLDGTAPGLSALDPVADLDAGPTRIGAGWMTSPGMAGPVTWHNGQTGGFRSWLGVDRRAGVGVAVVNARAVAPDRVAATVLGSIVRDA